MARWGFIFGSLGDRQSERGVGMLGWLVLAVVAPIAALIIQLAISRSREYQADATGAALTGEPDALASALMTIDRVSRHYQFHAVGDTPATASLFICNPFAGRRLLTWFSTHPPVAERVRRLRQKRTV